MLKEDLSFAVYITFNGNCRQAFNYYQTCFGGELTVQSMADTPYSNEISKEMRNIVICAILKNEYFKLVGTDLADQNRIIAGNNVSIMINCNSFTQRMKLINKLVGRNFCSVKNTNTLINITDMYSINWIMSVH